MADLFYRPTGSRCVFIVESFGVMEADGATGAIIDKIPQVC